MKIDKNKVKKFISLVFYAISIYYFYIVIRGMDFSNFKSINNIKTYITTVGLSIFHSLLLVYVAYIYSFNLVSFSNVTKSISAYTEVATQYLLANVAKYVPGNVVHYVGRNALLAERGYSHKQIAFNSLFEIALFAFTSLTIAMLTSFNYLIVQLDKYMDMKSIYLLLASLFIIGVIGITCILWYLKKYKQELLAQYSEFITKKLILRTLITILLYSVYFILLSTTLILVLYIIFNISFTFTVAIKIIGLFVVSYFIGMVAPGVPGGIGVREAVSIALISQYVDEEILLIAVILLRLITILGDIISFIYGKILDYYYRRKSE